MGYESRFQRGEGDHEKKRIHIALRGFLEDPLRLPREKSRITKGKGKAGRISEEVKGDETR